MLYNEDVCGKMDFTYDEIRAGKLNDFINTLIDMGCEIRIVSSRDGFDAAVEYIQSYRVEDGWHFLAAPEDKNQI